MRLLISASALCVSITVRRHESRVVWRPESIEGPNHDFTQAEYDDSQSSRLVVETHQGIKDGAHRPEQVFSRHDVESSPRPASRRQQATGLPLFEAQICRLQVKTRRMNELTCPETKLVDMVDIPGRRL